MHISMLAAAAAGASVGAGAVLATAGVSMADECWLAVMVGPDSTLIRAAVGWQGQGWSGQASQVESARATWRAYSID